MLLILHNYFNVRGSYEQKAGAVDNAVFDCDVRKIFKRPDIKQMHKKISKFGK